MSMEPLRILRSKVHNYIDYDIQLLKKSFKKNYFSAAFLFDFIFVLLLWTCAPFFLLRNFLETLWTVYLPRLKWKIKAPLRELIRLLFSESFAPTLAANVLGPRLGKLPSHVCFCGEEVDWLFQCSDGAESLLKIWKVAQDFEIPLLSFVLSDRSVYTGSHTDVDFVLEVSRGEATLPKGRQPPEDFPEVDVLIITGDRAAEKEWGLVNFFDCEFSFHRLRIPDSVPCFVSAQPELYPLKTGWMETDLVEILGRYSRSQQRYGK